MIGKPTFNRIILRVIFEKEVEQKTKSGIILPGGIDNEDAKKMKIFKEHPIRGEVVAIGDMVKICDVGDWCYFNGGLDDLIEDGTYYSITYESSVLYVVKKEDMQKYLESKKTSEILT